MKNFSQLLQDKSDTIIKNWLVAVRRDSNIKSDKGLSVPAIKNHLDYVLSALATVLSQSEAGDIAQIVEASLSHGVLRAEQGFDANEIGREYRLLRQEIFSSLEVDLLGAKAEEVIRTVRLVDSVVDEAIARCFQSYTEQRLGELEMLQTQLTLQNQELSRLVRVSQENVSHLAHELKNPLTSIIGYSDLFLRLQKQTIAAKEIGGNLTHIERVLSNGRHLLNLINNALEISRYEAGQMSLETEIVDVCKLILNVREVLDPLLYDKDLEINIDCQNAPKKIITDALRLQQIVTNIVSNAIRYTESGTIDISCKTLDNSKLQIAVSDTGIGISAEDIDKIFDPYFRAIARDKCSLPESTGLGLAIVLRLVKLLQGEIKVESELGVGSTFTVTLPPQV